MKMRVLTILLMGVLVASSASAIVYVNKANGGVADGTSWATAFPTIQVAIDAAAGAGGDDVWVAGSRGGSDGVYNEQRTENWGTVSVPGSLVLKDNVHVYGGFDATETTLSQRGVRLSITTIDGSVARAGLPAYHVVVCGNDATAVVNARLDGFTVSGGRATGVLGDYHTFYGAGMFIWLSNPTVANCTFTNNIATTSGGGIAIESRALIAEPIIENCVIAANVASRAADGLGTTWSGGGGIYINRGTGATAPAPSLFNCTVANNTIGSPGVGIYGANSGGIYDWESSPNLNSCIVYANNVGGIQDQRLAYPLPTAAVVSYSDIQGGFAGVGNINLAPQFASAELDLLNTSPCRDTGDPTNPAGFTRDLPGSTRPIVQLDMGAYEYVPLAPNALCLNPTVTLDGSGQVTVTTADIFDPATTADGGIYRVSANPGMPATFTCADRGPHTFQMIVTDYIGKTGTCNAVVTVVDTTAPTAACVDYSVDLSAAGAYTLAPADLAAITVGSTDNCAITSIAAVPNAFDCSNVGPNAVTVTLSDAAGNSTQCNITVTVNDVTPPTALCQDYTLTFTGSGGTITAANVDAGSNDACGIKSLAVAPDTFGCAELGANTVTLTVTDNNDLVSTCTATVTVVEAEAPVVVCNDITVTLAGSAYTLTQTDIDAIALGSSDNCGNVTAVVVPDSFTCDNLGDNTVTLTVTDSDGNSNSCNATVTVTRALGITDAAPTPQVKYVGEGAVMSVEACGGTAIANYAFAWFFDADGALGPAAPQALADGAPHPADPATTVAIANVARVSTLTLGNLQQATEGQYYCELNDGATTVTSGAAQVTVYDNLAIATSPADLTRNEIETASFNVVLAADSGIPPYSYDWQWDNGTTWVSLADGPHPSGSDSVISGAGTDTLSIALGDTGIQDAGQYRVVVTDSGAPQTVTSDEATLTVTNFMAAYLTPANVRAYDDEAVALTVNVGNGIPPYTFQWFKDGVLVATTPNTNATTDVLDLGIADAGDIGTYKVTVDDSVVINPPVDSNSCPVDVKPRPTISVQPVDEFVYAGQAMNFNVTVVDGFQPYTYVWRAMGAPIPGYPSVPVLTAPVPLAYNGAIVDVIIVDQGSTLSGAVTLDSNDVVLHVGTAITFPIQPEDHRAYSDEPSFDLSATFAGGLFVASYEWSRVPAGGGAATSFGVNTGSIPNTVTLAVNPAGEDGSYDYKVSIGDAVGATDSDPARVDFANHVHFTQGLADAEIVTHQNFSFEVVVEGGLPPVSYQWFKDDGAKAWQPITGANASSLDFPDPQESDSGRYRVEVTEGNSSLSNAEMISSEATLTVKKGIPVAGGLGLAALAAATALLGAARIRRRR